MRRNGMIMLAWERQGEEGVCLDGMRERDGEGGVRLSRVWMERNVWSCMCMESVREGNDMRKGKTEGGRSCLGVCIWIAMREREGKGSR